MKINQLWIGIIIGVLTSLIADCILILAGYAISVVVGSLFIAVTVLVFLVFFLKRGRWS
jgi:hypothetical protein